MRSLVRGGPVVSLRSTTGYKLASLRDGGERPYTPDGAAIILHAGDQGTRRRPTGPWLQPAALARLLLLACLLLAAPLHARTITLSSESLDAFAALSESNTINGWACYNYDYTRYTGGSLGGGPQTSYILRYSLDRIPKGMRITHAEWTIAHNVSSAHVNVWRLLGDWGLGVCYDYRTTYPKKLPWSVAGAKGKSTDRATNPTATGQFANGQLLNVNVTQDVEMWYSGAAPNRGWLITFDAFALLHSAYQDGHRAKWQLVITYEPE